MWLTCSYQGTREQAMGVMHDLLWPYHIEHNNTYTLDFWSILDSIQRFLIKLALILLNVSIDSNQTFALLASVQPKWTLNMLICRQHGDGGFLFVNDLFFILHELNTISVHVIISFTHLRSFVICTCSDVIVEWELRQQGSVYFYVTCTSVPVTLCVFSNNYCGRCKP